MVQVLLIDVETLKILAIGGDILTLRSCCCWCFFPVSSSLDPVGSFLKLLSSQIGVFKSKEIQGNWCLTHKSQGNPRKLVSYYKRFDNWCIFSSCSHASMLCRSSLLNKNVSKNKVPSQNPIVSKFPPSHEPNLSNQNCGWFRFQHMFLRHVFPNKIRGISSLWSEVTIVMWMTSQSASRRVSACRWLRSKSWENGDKNPWLIGVFCHPVEKYAQVKLEIFPNFRGEKVKIENVWNHHLDENLGVDTSSAFLPILFDSTDVWCLLTNRLFRPLVVVPTKKNKENGMLDQHNLHPTTNIDKHNINSNQPLQSDPRSSTTPEPSSPNKKVTNNNS